MGQALLGVGRVEEAELVLAGLMPGGPTDQQRAQLASARANTLYWWLNLPAEAETVLQHAQATITDPGSREELDCVRAGFRLQEGSCLQALEAVAGTLDRVGAQDRTVLQALLVVTPALFMVGRSDAAVAAAHRGLELAGRVGEQEALLWAPLWLSADLCHAYLAAGRLDEAEAVAQEGYQRALGQPWPLEKVLWAGWHGQVARARGQVRTALHWLRESAAAAERSDGLPLQFMPAVLGELAHAAALAGELPAAEAALAQADQFSAESARIYHQQWVAAARPWVAAARGELSTAIALAGVQGHLAPIYAAHASALAAQDGPALDNTADAFAGIGANLLAAEAAAEAAHAHRAAGRRSAALASTRTATTLAATCQGARTPALDLLTPQPPDLTRREHEIAGLAGRGLPSKAIAARLVISVRTVDNTLRQVYAKLGLASRSDLRSALNLPDQNGHPTE